MGIIQTFNQTVGTEQKSITNSVGDGTDLGIHELIATTQCFLEHIPPRMGPGLALIDLSLPIQPPHVSVIFGELTNASGDRQVVDSTVTHMGKVKKSRSKPAQAEGRLHATALLITSAQIDQGLVNFPEEHLQEHLGRISLRMP